MHYIFNNKDDYKRCINYLNLEKIDYQKFDLKNYKMIDIFDHKVKSKIENEEKSFLNTEKISLDNGYLVTKKYKNKTIVDVNGIKIGAEKPVIISGPCSIESEDILRKIAIDIKKTGVDILRGGAFKPRTSPYDFQGLGKKGIDILNRISVEMKMPVVSEILDIRDLEYMIDKVDILQVGSRNMYNYSLLKELGKIDKPILLKRGLSATIKEFLLSAEYIMSEGNEKVILCERGIRTYESSMRNTMDIASISLLNELTHLPIIADPSHATGKRSLIKPLSKAAIVAGANGLIIESHFNPDSTWTDANQSIDMFKVKNIVEIVNNMRY